MIGDLVIAPFPYTDLSDSKRRPVLVVADVGPTDRIVCEITSRALRRPGDIAITQQDMQSGTLNAASWIRPGHLHTISQSLFVRTVGRLSDAKQAEIATAIRVLF